MVGENAICLLGHRPVEAPQACLDMRQRQVKLRRCERAGEGRVSI
jgi:hypothetical protein